MSIAIIIVLVICIILFFVIKSKTKSLNLPNVTLITGGNKCGKTALGVSLVDKYRIENTFKWFISLPFHHIKKWFMKTFRKLDYEIPFKPMVYSNIPLGIPHNKLTLDIVLRRVKLPLNSIVFIDEASMLADSMLFKSDYINDQLRLFCKLFCHANGNDSRLILTTQSYSDLHYSFKRCIGSFLYIRSRTAFPFVTICKVREMLSIDDNSSNVSDRDFEETCKTMWFFNNVYKKYSSRCYSFLTDSLPYQVDYDYAKKKHDLICDEVLDLHDLHQRLVRDLKEIKK